MDPLAYWVTTSDMGDRKILDGILEKMKQRGLEGKGALLQALMEASVRYPNGAIKRKQSDDGDSRKATA